MTTTRTAPQQVARCTTCQWPSDDEVCAKCRDIRDTLPRGITVGAWVKMRGRQGRFRVMGYNREGSVKLYGGTSGHPAFRSAFADALTVTTAPRDAD